MLFPTVITITLLVLAVMLTLLQFSFSFRTSRALLGYQAPKHDDPSDFFPISVIVSAKNEENNLKLYLTEILEQDYPQFEVVVVNDCSYDESEWVLNEFKQHYPHLKVVSLVENIKFKHGKKFALTMGIKASSHEHLLFTDADCYPQSNQWLRHMASAYQKDTAFVLGYSPYVREKGFLNDYIRYETFLTALNYLGFALLGNPYMGVGRNLSYKKDMFFKGKGFSAHMHVPSGDDDLFVNQHAHATNTAICFHPEAIIWTLPKQDITSYIRQKQRHYGTGMLYKSNHKRLLTLQSISGPLAILIALATLFFNIQLWPYVLGFFILRWGLLYIGYSSTMKKMQVSDLLWYLPILDFSYQFGHPFIALLSFFRKKQVVWK